MTKKLLSLVVTLISLKVYGQEMPFDGRLLGNMERRVTVVVTQMPLVNGAEQAFNPVILASMSQHEEFQELLGKAFKFDTTSGLASTYTVWPSRDAAARFSRSGLHTVAKNSIQINRKTFKIITIEMPVSECPKNMTQALALLAG